MLSQVCEVRGSGAAPICAHCATNRRLFELPGDCCAPCLLSLAVGWSSWLLDEEEAAEERGVTGERVSAAASFSFFRPAAVAAPAPEEEAGRSFFGWGQLGEMCPFSPQL